LILTIAPPSEPPENSEITSRLWKKVHKIRHLSTKP